MPLGDDFSDLLDDPFDLGGGSYDTSVPYDYSPTTIDPGSSVPATGAPFGFNSWGVPDPTDSYFMGGSAPPASGAIPSSSSSGSFADWLKAIPIIGQVFTSTYNAINHPTAPSAYQTPAPQAPIPGSQDYQSQQAYPNGASGAAGAPASGGVMAWLQNPANLPIILLGGVGVLLLSSSGKR